MVFTTPQFVLFFLGFFWLYYSFKGRARRLFTLAASLYFYGSWNPWFLTLLLGSSALDYWVALKLESTDDERRRKRFLALSLIGNLGSLGFFKYFNFFVDSAVAGLQGLGLSVSAPALNIILPVGISFYTFQTLSYTLDVYWRRMPATHSLLDFALYVSFFPQLVAGPIERASHLLPQCVQMGTPEERPADLSGFGLIALGVFKKVVIADHFAALTDATYAHPEDTYSLALWLGTYAFAIQIYCDFSGYSDIAVGLGRLMGMDIMQNFEAPYAASGPSDFWRRWHISLSSWLRDYLYIPLGGNRGSRWFTGRNLLLTMLLGGLWHGAAWNFVLWGAFHGLLLIAFRPALFRRLSGWLKARPLTHLPSQILQRVLFFHLVCLSWALFRATSFKDSVTVIRKLIDPTTWELDRFLAGVEASGEGRYLAFMAASAGLLVLGQNLWPVGSNRVVNVLWRAPNPVKLLVVVALLYASVLLASEKPPPFIYFQF